MGVEFIRKAAKPFKKHWDKSRRDLATADLFTRQPACAGRSAPFDLQQNVTLHVGDTVMVEAQGATLVARLSLTLVGRTDNPPTTLLRAVQDSCGIAKGTIEHIHSLAQVAEITLC